MTTSVPQNAVSPCPDLSDFDDYEDLILEEFMSMTYGNDEQDKFSGSVHPSHFSGVSPEEQKLFQNNLPAIHSETYSSGEQYFAEAEYNSVQLETQELGNSTVRCSNAEYVQDISDRPYEGFDYQNPYVLEKSCEFEMWDKSEEKPLTPDVFHPIHYPGVTDSSPPHPHKFENLANLGCSKGQSSVEGWVSNSSADQHQPSTSNWCEVNTGNEADSDTSLETIEDMSSSRGYGSSQGSECSGRLVIDECPEEHELRPSVIVQPSAGDPTQSVLVNNNSQVKEPRTIIGEELQQQLEWRKLPANSSCLPVTNVGQALPWIGGNHSNYIKHAWMAGNTMPSMHIEQRHDSTAKDRRQVQQDSDVTQPDINDTDERESYVGDPDIIHNQEMDESTHWANLREPMWSQQFDNSVPAVGGRNERGFHGDQVQVLGTISAQDNHSTNTETPQTSNVQKVTPNPLVALASMGLFQYSCDEPNCPGDISRGFQEFPFPRRKTANRVLDQTNSTLSSSSRLTEDSIPDILEVEPNQDAHRLLLRRMRNREAAKRCRKKKKQEFIALLFKRAALIAEYHRLYHIYRENIVKF